MAIKNGDGGKYEDVVKTVRECTGADGAVVMIFGGVRGHGMAVNVPQNMLHALPPLLRDLANSIERDINEL